MARVLQLIETSGPGGAEVMLTRLAVRLAQRGHEPFIGLLREGWLSERVREAGLDLHILPLGCTPDVTWVRKVTALVRKLGVQVIHTHEFAMNSYGALVSMLTGVPAVATVHGKNYYAGRRRRRLAYRLVAKRARMVAVSADIRSYLASVVGVRPELVTTVYNGVDTGQFRPSDSARARVRATLGVDAREVLLGSVGSLYPVKGHAVLLAALARLRHDFPAVPLLLVGRGSEEDRLRAMVADLGLGRQVRFLGLRSDVPDLLAALDVFILPSLSEGTPLSVLEAMASGVPVIATAVGGVPEIVEDGETGVLVGSGDPEALAEGLRRLMADGSARRRMGQAGRRRVETTFSLDTMVIAYERLYGLGSE